MRFWVRGRQGLGILTLLAIMAYQGRISGQDASSPAPPLGEIASGDSLVVGEIERMLVEQQDAWNRGDLAGFMEPYWKSEDLTFSAGGTTVRGWQATFDRYRKRYPDKSSMGRLAFSELEVRLLGESAGFVLGRWRLEREVEPVGGNFTLIVQRIGGDWRIVHDHTSVSETTPATPE